MSKDQCALSEIIEKKCREDECEPGNSNRSPAKMTHVGVKRLSSGDCKHNCAKQHESGKPMRDKKSNSENRVYRCQYLRCAGNLYDTEQRDRKEPDCHDRSKNPSDFCCSFVLHPEQPDQDAKRDRNYENGQRRSRNLETFYRAKD